MSWHITEYIGELRDWPGKVNVFRGDTDEHMSYLPRVSTMRVVSDVSDGVGSCKCFLCAAHIDPNDAYCRRCGAELVGTVYQSRKESE